MRGSVLGEITVLSVTSFSSKSAGRYILATDSSTLGAQVPKVVLAADADATLADVAAPVYRTGIFNANALIWGGSLGPTSLVDVNTLGGTNVNRSAKESLAARGLFVQESIHA